MHLVLVPNRTNLLNIFLNILHSLTMSLHFIQIIRFPIYGTLTYIKLSGLAPFILEHVGRKINYLMFLSILISCLENQKISQNALTNF